MPQIHPDPILSPSVVKNVLADPDLTFPSFIFSSPALSNFCVSRVFRGHALFGFCAFCAFCGGLKSFRRGQAADIDISIGAARSAF